MSTNQIDVNKLNAAYGKAVRKAWSDPAFRAKLLADPRAVLVAEGAAVPAGVTIKVMENTDEVIHFVLPARPSDGLPETALAAVGGGLTRTCSARSQ